MCVQNLVAIGPVEPEIWAFKYTNKALNLNVAVTGPKFEPVGMYTSMYPFCVYVSIGWVCVWYSIRAL